MSKVIQYKNGHNTGGQFDIPGYEYDAVNDIFTDLSNGHTFSSRDNGKTVQYGKSYTLNASNYTIPVTVRPDPNFDGIGALKIVLTDIPSKTKAAYAWQYSTTEGDPAVTTVHTVYFNFDVSPENFVAYSNTFKLENGAVTQNSAAVEQYSKTDDVNFTANGITYTRVAASDFTLWQVNS